MFTIITHTSGRILYAQKHLESFDTNNLITDTFNYIVYTFSVSISRECLVLCGKDFDMK